MKVKIKICGVTTPDAVEAAVEAGAFFIGFVFFEKSPRHLSPEQANELAALIPPGIKKVAVMVDPTDKDLKDTLSVFRPDYIQLHGNETPERVRDIRASFSIPIIKAFKVRSSDDVSEWGKYSKVADMVLFDARAPESSLPGGNGLSFDWNLIKNRRITSPWLLSGGLNATNIAEAIAVSGAKMVDVSSSIESAPGIKDPEMIREFIEAVKKA